jgi:hypothetical protein
MSNEENTIMVSHALEEDQGTSNVVEDGFAVENCSAQCPTCQQSFAYTAGYTGLRHCEKGHEWV